MSKSKFEDRETLLRAFAAAQRLDWWIAFMGYTQDHVANLAKVGRSTLTKFLAISTFDCIEAALVDESVREEAWPNRSRPDSQVFKLIRWVELNCASYDIIDESKASELVGKSRHERHALKFAWRTIAHIKQFLGSTEAFVFLDDLFSEAKGAVATLPPIQAARTMANFALAFMATLDKVSLLEETTSGQLDETRQIGLEMKEMVCQELGRAEPEVRYYLLKACGYLGDGFLSLHFHEGGDKDYQVGKKLLMKCLSEPFEPTDGHWANILRKAERSLAERLENASDFALRVAKKSKRRNVNSEIYETSRDKLYLPNLSSYLRKALTLLLLLIVMFSASSVIASEGSVSSSSPNHHNSVQYDQSEDVEFQH